MFGRSILFCVTYVLYRFQCVGNVMKRKFILLILSYKRFILINFNDFLKIDAKEIFEKSKSYLLKEFETYFKLLQQLLEQSTSVAKTTYQKSIESSVVVTQSVLQTAQPYVHQAVTLSQPYIAQAVEVCTHEPVKAYLDPIRVVC